MARILIVDDDRDQRYMLSLLAQKGGLQAETFDQFEAQAVNWRHYDLVIVDAMMPVINGPRLVREQKLKLGKEMPRVVMLSAMPIEQLRSAAKGLDVELMTKTGSLDQIIKRLQEAARQSS